jgi:hypothetical protein
MNGLEIDLTVSYQTVCVRVTAIVPKGLNDAFVAEFLRTVSRAFAAVEGVSEEWMHEELEGVVEGFEDDSNFMFVWTRPLTNTGDPYSVCALRES